MVNFNLIVEDILLNEAVTDVPDWFSDFIKKNDAIFQVGQVNDSDIEQIFNLLDDADTSDMEIWAKAYRFRYVYDFMQTLYDAMGKPKPKDVATFKKQLFSEPANALGQKISAQVQTFQKPEQFQLKNKKVIKELGQAKEGLDKQSEIAFTEYQNDSILGAIQKIINKRFDVWSRLGKLKNPISPFQQLVTKIFETPEKYQSGTNSYSGDFEGVDKLYIQDIIDVAVAAKEFFAAEIGRLKMTVSESIKTDELVDFKNLVNEILLEQPDFRGGSAMSPGGLFVPSGFSPQQPSAPAAPTSTAPTPAAPTPAAPTKPKQQQQKSLIQKALDWEKYYLSKPDVKERYKKIKDALKQDEKNYMNFISGKPIQYKLVDPNTGLVKSNDIKQTEPNQYTLGSIDKMQTTESKNLINSIKKISSYIRKGVGAGERLQQGLQAASAISSFAGAKTYG